jgi:UDP-glucose 4-epimerase
VSVYGSSVKNQMMNEQSKLNPKTYYSISKMRGESFAERLFDKIPTHIVRLGNLYGFNQSMRFDAVINRFAFDANFTKKISIHGDGMQERSFINIDKAAKIITQLLIKEDAPNNICNLTDFNMSIMDIAMTMKEIYPDLEMQFINQHLKLRNLSVESNCDIFDLIPKETSSFKQEMQHMIMQFAFH